MIVDAVRLRLSGANSPQPDRRSGPWRPAYVGPPTFAGLNRLMYRITCPSRARLHARSQVLAHAPWPDTPDNRPLSNGSGGRLWPDEHVAVKAMPPYPRPGIADAAV